MTKSANELIIDIAKISTRAFQWKTNFNWDLTKQTQENIFGWKLQNTNHPCSIFSHNTVSFRESQKHLGIVLDSRLDFKEHLGIIFKKVSKIIGLACKLQNLLPRKSISVYKSFLKSHLGYGDIIYDQAYNASFVRK